MQRVTDFKFSILSILDDISTYEEACNSALVLAKEYSYERWCNEWSNIINNMSNYKL